MKQTIKRISEGVYRVTDKDGTFMIRGGYATNNGLWVACDCDSDCDNVFDLDFTKDWAVAFKTKKELLKYSQSF
jgi:hypothetical protein